MVKHLFEVKDRWMMVVSLSFIICHLSFSPIGAQTLLSEYQPGVTQDGAIYRLPKTAVAVTVRAVKTTYIPGDFAKYAQRYLRLNNVSTEPIVKNEVVSVQQSAFAVADTTKTYAVKFDSRTVAANIKLSADGCLLAINSESVEGGTDYSQTHNSTLSVQSSSISNTDPHQYLTEEILAAGSTAKMAELTAQEIYDIRENRNLLIKGQADFMPKDGEQLRLMLNQLQQQDDALTSLFAGSVSRDTTERTFIVCPSKPIDSQVLFRFSQLRGLVDADDLSGVPYYIKVEDLNTVPSLVADAAATKKKQKSSDKGIYVNVPSKMRLTISQGNDLVDAAEHPAPQFGHVELLSDQLFNKRYTTHLLLSPVSGAVDKLEAELPKK
jgi:hypothetical protein